MKITRVSILVYESCQGETSQPYLPRIFISPSARSWLGTITEIVAFLNIVRHVTVSYVPMTSTGKVNIWKYNVTFFTLFFGKGEKK